MKLKPDIKKRIDDYFENITPEELLNKAINEYGFKIEDMSEQTEGMKMAESMKAFLNMNSEVDQITEILGQAIDLRIDKRDKAIEVFMTFILQGYTKFGGKYYYFDDSGNITKEFVKKVIEETYTY